ncbi:hypothetical protein Agabi119p4_4042 [Agaricus bisporus var. burnettii]|uniref:Cytochrome P450 n=1 Tax=Agaricus bisporus var. burnettii TaxID=192524 RepID=A0A8H7KGL1_AGABI|nr:hypothetical protein Agabi119p4_4042 [Agaricus bisporus var. burnettii]
MLSQDKSLVSVYSVALLFFSALCVKSILRKRRDPLEKIPTVGPSSLWLHPLASLGTFFYGHQMIQEGYYRYPIFKITRCFSWLVVVSGQEYLEDLRKASAEQLSFPEALNKAGQFDHTISPGLVHDVIHINAVRGVMNRNIATRFPELLDEMDQAMDDLLGKATEAWVSIPCYKSAVHIISRVGARFFVGAKLSATRRFMDIMLCYGIHIIKGGFVISLFPEWLKPLVAHAIFNTEGKIREVEDFIRPIITERCEDNSDLRTDGDANDMISWLWNASPQEQRTVRDIAIRVIYLAVAATHNSSSLLTHVLLNLATYNTYVEPLREEISTIVQADGWTKEAVDKMRKLDSFVKETQRLHGGDAAMIIRLAMSDFTFSDGTFIPKGSSLAVSGRAMNQDERCHADPLEFQGFRFVGKDPLKWQTTALNSEFMTFGVGRHACPGRFFAITEVKLIAARILLDYEIKLTDKQGQRPDNSWLAGIFAAPNKKAHILLKRRV